MLESKGKRFDSLETMYKQLNEDFVNKSDEVLTMERKLQQTESQLTQRTKDLESARIDVDNITHHREVLTKDFEQEKEKMQTKAKEEKDT